MPPINKCRYGFAKGITTNFIYGQLSVLWNELLGGLAFDSSTF
ncbi:MAG: hypothetical protein WA240_04900 [Nitrospirota bacterium]